MPDSISKKRVLVIHYSQTGQLDRVAQSVAAPLLDDEAVLVDFLPVRPVEAYPFPWPFLQFINTFPESAHQVPCPLDVQAEHLQPGYDLVILAYQVWYLAPSIPISSFLQSDTAARLLADTPVVTVIACRNMWLQAQEKVKAHLQRCGARLVGNIALVDAAGSIASFFATPLWVLTGRKGPHWFGLVPSAGVSQEDVDGAQRFGETLRQRLLGSMPLEGDVLDGLDAAPVNDKLILSEKIGTRSFYLWGKLFLACGGPDSMIRTPLAALYTVFLLLMIVTVVPITAVLKWLFSPLLKKRIARQKAYYAGSAESAGD
ncbi:dialkylrecorsinol condensing enzyme [Pseudomonas sp. gcc21]|uniref:dialkylrecorsinol condensing enzyme n=1 Tax=Pseudomonas sp. gcc21 TaxID=2726989 RepID=UPI002115A2B4|nr:dialkylrecorsinol condensing enzyme [Pseudomonas sp. gcc21]